jgi:DNA-binding SARP family transcriptional activator/TolB-like protein
MFSLNVLGALALVSDRGPLEAAARQKRRVGLLAILAVAGPRGISRERIQSYLWPESASARSRHALDQLLYATARALDAKPFLSSGGELRLDASVVRSDVCGFEEAMRRHDRAAAVALYGGPLLDGVHLSEGGELERWIDGERSGLEHQYRTALEALAREAGTAGDATKAAAWWRKLGQSDPLSSRVARETVQALAAAGERAAAIQYAHGHQRLVRAELGVEPDPDIQHLVAGLAPRTGHLPQSTIAPPATSAPLTSIAVLPFVFLNDIANGRALSLGFADALITIFANLEDLAVAPTATILRYPADAEPAIVCRELGTSHALRGTVQTLGSRWRVSIQLFDARAARVVLSEKHDCTIDDLFDVQDEIGRRVVASLHRHFPASVPRSRDRYSDDAEAYDEFMTGLREGCSGDKETMRSAAAHLARAVERDPRFALAHATLSLVCMDMHFSFDAQRSWLNSAEEHCRRALALDDGLPEGQLARAWILWSPAKGFQHVEAIAALERVLAARPQLERAHNRMSGICGHIGRLDEAQLAHERAQCANPLTRSGNLEWLHIYRGDFVRAEEAVEAWFRDRPDNFYSRYTRIIPPLSVGDLALAEERLELALSRAPGEPLLVSLEALLHAHRLESAAALECVGRAVATPRSFGHTHHTYYQLAGVYAMLGDAATAMAWLERSVDNGFACWPFFRVDPHLANLRGDRAFVRLVADLERTYSTLAIDRV